ncbi:hypothetical protein BN85402150 [Alteracholeplasma palmae J233]|uniref:Tail specific protease domain-containing protein n=2 Tax=Acholeplasma palmae TaxID=38986 RepID=U4KJY5_ALTPJ|nr:hypothetical protein BN85402150 [Alteracholeplasma palmae J233]
MTDKDIELSYQNPLEKSSITYTYRVTTENRKADASWYILTSKVTFSAANLMASIAKNQSIATLIGTQSGGGASSIIPVISPTGTAFHMSSLNVLSYKDKQTNTYHDIENGIKPDIELPVSKLNDYNHILNLIKNNK